MEIKPFILLVSIFYLLHSSSSIRSSSSNNSPDAPDAASSTPKSPDGSSSTPAAPDAGSSTPDAPDETSTNPASPDADDSSPESPYSSVDKTPIAPAEGPSATFSFPSKPDKSSPELEKICQTTKLPIECVKYVSLFLNNSVKIEPITVAMTGIRAATEMTKQAIETATKFMDEPGASASLKEAMSTCLDNYQSIPDDNDLALQALEKRNTKEASYKLSYSLTSMDTCFDGISQMRITSPMRDMESELERLLRINLQLVSDMEKS
ncbi:hypothetical protein V6N13_093632 [Hibiscus sabdariffa]|uniref:Pectinesterase inhibitor domain-containing protein n=2 Tax=Hibiscus sabdariffa TaxID=183260 RepID=A0ABR2BS92_9ROSI